MPAPSSAHHTSSISYVYQKVGEKAAGCFTVEVISLPPGWIPRKSGKNHSRKARHKILDKFTHRFQVNVRWTNNLKSIGGLRVLLEFAQGSWRKSNSLQTIVKNGDPAYASNVALGPRGAYGVTALIEGLPLAACPKLKGGPVQLRFTFEYDYETVKQVMRAMEDALKKMGGQAVALGLDGEFISPGEEAAIRKEAAKLKDLIPWTVNLREGAAQNIYEDRAAKLLEIAEGIEAAARKGDFTALIRRLADARVVCAACHDIFQEADSTGALPSLPGAGK